MLLAAVALLTEFACKLVRFLTCAYSLVPWDSVLSALSSSTSCSPAEGWRRGTDELERAVVQQSPSAWLTASTEFLHQPPLARNWEPSAAPAAASKPQLGASAELGLRYLLQFASRPPQFFPSHPLTLNLQSQTSQCQCWGRSLQSN